jgi:hypothetical protein
MRDYDGDTSSANLSVRADYCPPQINVNLTVNNNVDDICLKEDNSVFIPVVANIVGGDGNETLTLYFDGFKPGWSFMAPAGQFWQATGVPGQLKLTLPAGTASFNGGFTLRPDANKDVDLTGLKITAVATDPDSAGATSSDGFNVFVDAVVDTPVVNAPTTLGPFGWYFTATGYNVPLNIAANVTDTDGSEQITKIVIDLSNPFNNPAGPFWNLDSMGIGLNKGVEVAPGIWEIPVNAGNAAAALAGLALIVPDNMDYFPIHQAHTGYHDANITVKTYVSEVNLSGNECDYSDNNTVIIKNICLTFYITPLVMDMNGDGINLLAQEAGVMFDMNNDGVQDHTTWVSQDDGLLAIDLNNDGIINNQSELFGNNETVSDGFANLEQYDSNGDGVINVADDVFSKLLVWQDANSDGISQAEEMYSLFDLGVIGINLNATLTNQQVADGLITHVSSFQYADGSEGKIVDAQFNVKDGASDLTLNTINGTDGNDVIYGTDGNDKIAGGEGNDVLYGNGGDDVFVIGSKPIDLGDHNPYQTPDTIPQVANDNGGVDTIGDFEIGDVLDISGLLQGYDPVQDSINDFVFKTESNGNTTVFIDPTGSGDASHATAVAILQGVTGLSIEEITQQSNQAVA